MKGTILQILLLALLASLCLGGYLALNRCLQLPFRTTNDALHEEGFPINLDFLIPAGTYIDEKMTIGEVIRIRYKTKATIDERILQNVSNLVPRRYRFLADLGLFLFWSFLFMTFLRVFTFAGYGRALRMSLFLGACTYYFMPDFSPGKMDDALFMAAALLIIFFRAFVHHRKMRSHGGY